MTGFTGSLRLEALCNSEGKPLVNRNGRRLWLRLSGQTYCSDKFGVFLLPKGQITDLGSVPRLPIVFYDLGNIPGAEEGFALHDWLYEHKSVPRKAADDILLEAMCASGVDWRRRNTVYHAVRLFGGSRYE